LKSKTKRQVENEEERLIRRGIKGDRGALEKLFGRQAGSLYQSAFRLLGNHEDAEDALQEGMLSAYRNLPRFEGRSQFSTWLTRIVINAALMRLRSRRARPAVSIDEPWGENEITFGEQLADPGLNPEELMARQELNDLLQQNLTALSIDMQAVLRLRDVEGFSTREAARTLEVPENTLKSRLHRARHHLAQRLNGGSVSFVKSRFQGGLA
jgi:RNA polymerase sigma-70 factor (ECF subfamily)